MNENPNELNDNNNQETSSSPVPKAPSQQAFEQHDPWVMPADLTEPSQPIEQPLTPAAVPPSPDQPSDSNFIAPAVVKKSRKGLVAIVILTVLLLAALGYIAYTTFFQNKDTAATPTATTTTQQQTAVVSPNAQAVVEKIRTALTDNLTTTYPTMTIADTTNSPAYKADDVDYAVHTDSLGHGLTIAPESNTLASDGSSATKIEAIIEKTLTSDKSFKKTDQQWHISYQNTAVVCDMSVSESPVTISCADTSAYKEAITSLKPYATAYFASDDNLKYSDSVLFGNPTVTSKPAGYSSAVVSVSSTKSPVGGYAGLFYAKDGNWTYFKGTQSILLCSDYNMHDLQEAFQGDVCDDGKGELLSVKVTL